MGARAHAMGHASATLGGPWAMHNNIAGLAETQSFSAAAAYHAIPSFPFHNRMAAVLAIPIKDARGGIGAFRFGDDLYNEQVLSLGFANTFGLASLGLRLNYIQYRAAGLEPRTALTVGFGGIARLTGKLFFGGYIVNINQPVINAHTGEHAPTTLFAGISFRPSENLMLNSEIEKDLAHDPILKAGMEYRFLKKVAFRTGFNLHPESGYFGIGWQTSRLDIDYALQVGRVPGAGHQASILYRLTKR